jgi:hypothetical protein
MATVMATTWVMATVTRLAGGKEGKGEGGKGDGGGDVSGRQQRGNGNGSQWRQCWRVSDGDGDEEGEIDCRSGHSDIGYVLVGYTS